MFGFWIEMNVQLPAQENEKKEYPPAMNYSITEAVSKIKIDGLLDEEAWQKATNIDLPFEWLPGDNTPSIVKTECLVTFSKSNLYIAFRCFDPEPRKIRAHLMNRDSIDTFILDDHVSFMIDSFNDELRAYQFRINPLGVQADAIFSPIEGFEDFSWDAIWYSAGKITDYGYTVEIAIPFNQLRFNKKQGQQTWGFSAERSYPRTARHRMTTHVRARDRNCILCQFNKITGFHGITPGRNIEFDPTLTLHRTDQQNMNDFPNGQMKTGTIKAEPGITAKWGVTPNLILNTTINPDFSQVEADVAQLEVNTRFALRYPEKRPFFLESADYFLTPLEVMFTRTVYDPVWGVKATGKAGKNVLAFFAAQDKYNNLLFPSNQGSSSASVKKDVYGGVLRYRRDVGAGSTLGLLYTGRLAKDYYNHVVGIDGFFQISRTKNISVQFLRSQTQYPGEISSDYGQRTGAFGGNAFSLRFDHFDRNLNYQLQYQDLAPGFRADYGFIPRVDFRRMEAVFTPVIWGKQGDWFDRIFFTFRGDRITDHNNKLSNQEIEIFLQYNGPLQSVFQQNFVRAKEFYNGKIYDLNRFDSFFELKPIGGMDIIVFARVGDTVDYDNSRPARMVLLNPAVEFSLGRHVNIKLDHIFERLSRQGNEIYTANLLQARFIYNFNIRTFVRAIIQYTDIDRNTGLYEFPIDPETKELFTQFLFSYKINPKTVLFIGYSDNHLGYQGIDLKRTDRTFFFKIGYALVL